MKLTKDQFKLLYKDTQLIDYYKIYYSSPTTEEDFKINYLSSKLWRLNNLYTIVDKLGNRIKFDMNLSQHRIYSQSLSHSKLIILKSRQQGISTLWLIVFFDDCIFNSDFNSGLMAQGQDEAEMLLGRTKLLWDALSDSIKTFLNIEVVKNNTKEFSFSNNSTIFVRTSFRSTTLQRLHISEFGKIANKNAERARETVNGTLQAIAPGNTIIIESTAEGDNMYRRMWNSAIALPTKARTDRDFKPIFLSWLDDPDCVSSQDQTIDATITKYFAKLEKIHPLTQEQKNFWIIKYRELGNDIYQEYPATEYEAFLKNREGTYYANLYIRYIRNMSREIKNLWDSNLPVQVAVDLGRNDYFVLIFFQTYVDGIRIIDDYHNTGHGIEHYCEVMDTLTDYDIQLIILPHDANVRDLTSNITREEAFHKYGYHNTIIVPKTPNIDHDRELVRQAMYTMFIDVKAQYIINCFLNYSKDWDQIRGIWKDLHLHNEYSHGADALRQLVRGAELYTKPVPRRQTRGFQI